MPPTYAYTPSIAFQSGAYPNTVIPAIDMDLLEGNYQILTGKELISGVVTSAPTPITQATAGAWTTLDFLPTHLGRTNKVGVPLIVQLTALVTFSAAVANKVLFSWFNNVNAGAVHYKLSAVDVNAGLLIVTSYIIPTSQPVAIKWQVESAAPNLTVSMPNGYRLIGWQI